MSGRNSNHMLPSLDNPRLKTERADEHLSILRAKVDSFMHGNPFRWVWDYDERRDQHLYRLEAPSPPPRKLGLIAADFFYNLRSSLDQLAWQLALLTTDDPFDRTEFPIFRDPERFRSVTKRGAPTRGSGVEKMQDMPPGAQELIEELQPYHEENPPDTHPLWIIHQACNIDKHRQIFATPTRYKLPIGADTFLTGPFQDGDEIGTVGSKHDIKPDPTISIAFDVGAPRLIDLDDLQRLSFFVRHGVIERFASFFTPA